MNETFSHESNTAILERKTSVYQCLQLRDESMKCNYPSAPKKNKTKLQHESELWEKG